MPYSLCVPLHGSADLLRATRRVMRGSDGLQGGVSGRVAVLRTQARLKSANVEGDGELCVIAGLTKS